MEPKVYEGKVMKLTEKDVRVYKLERKDFLAIDVRYREAERPQMIALIDSLFREFLDKIVKITIEEVKA